jgi:type IV pilus assembly protein PilM
MFFFKKRSTLHLGIDLGASSLKAVLLEKNQQKNILKNYGYLKNNFKGKREFTDQEIIDLLKQLLSKMGIKSELKVAFALPVSQSFITELTLPPMSPEEIEKSIEFQAKQHIPVPLEQVYLSWQMIEEPEKKMSNEENGEQNGMVETKEKIQPKTKILLAAAPKDIIARYQSIAKNLNLNLKGLEIETFALARSCVADNDSYLIVDIGAVNTNMTIVENGYLHLNRNLDFGGDSFTAAIAKHLNIEWDRAEKIKKEQGLLSEGGEKELTEVLYPLIDKMITEVDRVVSTYQLRENRDIREIILSGGTGQLKGLKEYFESKSGYPVKIADPWLKISYPEILKNNLKKIGTSFAVASGLALL